MVGKCDYMFFKNIFKKCDRSKLFYNSVNRSLDYYFSGKVGMLFRSYTLLQLTIKRCSECGQPFVLNHNVRHKYKHLCPFCSMSLRGKGKGKAYIKKLKDNLTQKDIDTFTENYYSVIAKKLNNEAYIDAFQEYYLHIAYILKSLGLLEKIDLTAASKVIFCYLRKAAKKNKYRSSEISLSDLQGYKLGSMGLNEYRSDDECGGQRTILD